MCLGENVSTHSVHSITFHAWADYAAFVNSLPADERDRALRASAVRQRAQAAADEEDAPPCKRVKQSAFDDLEDTSSEVPDTEALLASLQRICAAAMAARALADEVLAGLAASRVVPSA
jgi:hypothetical protein